MYRRTFVALEEIQSTSQTRFACFQTVPIVSSRGDSNGDRESKFDLGISKSFQDVYQHVVSDDDKAIQMQSQLDSEQFQARFELVSHPVA